ncbi:MAG: energy transducer TonB, partial [Flavobacteriales bacterium]|nr:energy transducer TonB [Flavobacteriales bacterium]
PSLMIGQANKTELADSLSTLAYQASSQQMFDKADSLLMEAISIMDRKDLRAQLGMVKVNLQDTCGGCQQMKKAVAMGNKKTSYTFQRICTQLDSAEVGKDHPMKPFASNQSIRTELCSDSLEQVFYQTTTSGKEVTFTVDSDVQKPTEKIDEEWKGKVAHKDLVFKTVETLPMDKAKNAPFSNLSMMQHLMMKMSYPDELKEEDVHGLVEVSFIIGLDGSVEDIEIIQSLHPVLDKEAMRLVSILPELKAAEVDGKPVRMLYIMPINF